MHVKVWHPLSAWEHPEMSPLAIPLPLFSRLEFLWCTIQAKPFEFWLGAQTVWNWRMPTAALPRSLGWRLEHMNSHWRLKTNGTCRAGVRWWSLSRKVGSWRVQRHFFWEVAFGEVWAFHWGGQFMSGLSCFADIPHMHEYYYIQKVACKWSLEDTSHCQNRFVIM